MKPALKILYGVVSVFAATIIIGYILIHTLLNPMMYQKQIKQAFYTNTHQHLAINGDISVNFFPWIGFTIKDVVVSNPAPITVQPFAKIGILQLRLS